MIVKNSIIFIVLLILSCSCSNKYNPYLGQNKFINDYYLHYSNDSIKIAFKSPSDIRFGQDSIKFYFRDQPDISKKLRKIEINEIIFHGSTKMAPDYKWIGAIGKESFVENGNEFYHNDEIVGFQNIIADGYFLLLGMTKKQYFENMKSDMLRTVNSITYGESYNPKVPESPLDIILENLKKDSFDRYIDAVLNLRNKKSNYSDELYNQAYQQMYLTAASMISGDPEFDSVLNAYNKPRQRDYSDINYRKNYPGIYGKEVWEKIADIASKSNLVMFNEMHWDKKNRHTILQLLPLFKEAGYKYLALEALFEDYDSTMDKGYPDKGAGLYISEPTFSQIVRIAVDLGFELVRYDYHENENREVAQARNIYTKTFEKDPKAKVLVYAGIGHIHESKTGENPRMAAKMDIMYNINPVTIDMCILGRDERVNNADKPVLLTREEILAMSNPGLVTDYYLGVPVQEDFILQQENLRKVEIEEVSQEVLDETIPLISSLFFKDELDNSGPSAIPLYNDWGIRLKYQLAPGDYVWVVIDQYGDFLERKEIVVD